MSFLGWADNELWTIIMDELLTGFYMLLDIFQNNETCWHYSHHLIGIPPQVAMCINQGVISSLL